MLSGKNVVVGVTGGIAVYKACDVVNRIKKMGANVKVIMTKSACEFVTPMTFQTLSNNFVTTDMFEEPKTWDVEHIEIAKMADLFLIVPATANIIGKVANGIADDMLSTTVMATKSPVVFAPAMNTNMYENEIVQNNIKRLKKYGYRFIDPSSGLLACGDIGVGKLADVDEIVDYVENFFDEQDVKDLNGINILITAGPTIESIDPVRYITNRSSGKMGYAIAKSAVERGANVTLISGKTNLPIPKKLSKFINIESAEDLYNAVTKEFENNQVVIQSAAVADYKPKEYSDKKIKKKNDDLEIKLSRNKDIALELGKIKGDKVLIGFAAETNDVLENATKKIEKKNLDFIVANDLTKEGAGFASDTNIVKFIYPNGDIRELPKMEKSEVGNHILDDIKVIIENK
ncbi:bifunctional phosphopantothenoylcysteine decarboxylase/phosphopantothenate--cysteine ligase CoaBC [Peptostreptococcus anaerobius]|uniref:Coenzyme A biosynthesis bifunctional protein CoaBC n=1 Tax=Peptostreptococcus porci TaxID=2652282 RepID=A0A6N7XIA6_9FIRM|nr:bifunctional phosphopantothenoylcysteine decarboxylase/phosphopantothenate--cysteine ligase CoaBC [Peptostreptococcus porci]MST63144.1 bifunctional phosphopantothenoylcysteine decarboxylase/phosphopantothenate--cysteine ligase CoaBC [Peptostreptococcus porci]